MDKKLFDELLASVKEMDRIARGKRKPSRRAEYPEKRSTYPPVPALAMPAGVHSGPQPATAAPGYAMPF
ncbi:MAG: hypothetical protein H6995_09165 [Pseudomonadales bacterium]|nr:hypothetical protein [Pseudomonadales bacterium]